MSHIAGCQFQWGTSVACPVVTGALALILSSVGKTRREALRSPAAIKQVLHRGARRMPRGNIFEQGPGLLDLHATAAAIEDFEPHVSVYPASLDLTPAKCGHLWPLCDQPLYASAQPVLLNLTVLNSRHRPRRLHPHDRGGGGGGASFAKPPTWHFESATPAPSSVHVANPSELLGVHVAHERRLRG